MAAKIAYFMIFGKPLIMYSGMVALLAMLATGLLGFLVFTGRTTIPIRWHARLAAAAIILAVLHGLLGILLYF